MSARHEPLYGIARVTPLDEHGEPIGPTLNVPFVMTWRPSMRHVMSLHRRRRHR